MSEQREPTHAEYICVRAIKEECARLIPSLPSQELHMIRNIAMTQIIKMHDVSRVVRTEKDHG